MAKLSVRDLDVKGKRVFVRVDFNVPLNEDGTIRSDSRIRAALPTVKLLLERRAVVLLASHLGKAKGRPDPKFTLAPVAARLRELLAVPVAFASDCIGEPARAALAASPAGTVVLLENLRFHPGEEKNDPGFCRELASLADRYVNDAFGTAHRAHASTAGMAALFQRPAAGLLMQKEVEFLGRVTGNPARPYVAIIGGSKVSDKAGVIANLLPRVDRLLVGGGCCFNFLKAKGLSIGKSLWEPELMDQAAKLANDPKLLLPADFTVASAIDDEAAASTAPASAMPDTMMGLDIGLLTVAAFRDAILQAKTIVWAGPMGVCEREAFARGTREVALALVTATGAGAVTVVGGGDTVAALSRFKLADKVTHASTGGGASLEFLEGRILPGVAALADA